MAVAKEIMKKVVDPARRLLREYVLKWINSYISRKRTFKEVEEEANNMQNAEQDHMRKRARRDTDDGSSYFKKDKDDGSLIISTTESKWSPIQFPITGGRQLLKSGRCSYMPLRMNRKRTSYDSPLVIKKPMETKKQGVLLAYELLVSQQSREAARKILEHVEQVHSLSQEKTSTQLKSNDDCQISSRSLEPLALTIKENTIPVSSSNGLSTSNIATPSLGIKHCNICLGPSGASSGITNVVKSIPIVPKKMKGFRMGLSDVYGVPKKTKGFRMGLSEVC